MLDSIPTHPSIHQSNPSFHPLIDWNRWMETQTQGEPRRIRPSPMCFLVRFDPKNSFACTQA